ncbi:tRNA lysidine(34) synthetase TilS, partial [bacterium]|nr:tRNA lysidine(34) synthetase TilS [bacterium]
MAHLVESLKSLEKFSDLPWYCALSGGMDSVVLLDLVARSYPGKITGIIHINHQLQEPSEQWESFCKSLAEHYHIPFKSHKLHLSASSENAARQARYQVFYDYLHEPAVLLMAHHLDDQLETLFWRVLRGSPLQGIIGIDMIRELNHGWVIRPLLKSDHRDIELYAQQHQLTWCLDPSNKKTDYTRNFLRNAIIPQLEERYPSLKKQLAKTHLMCQYNHDALLYWLKPYLKSAQHLDWSDYPDKSHQGVFTLVSYWLTTFHYPHPSCVALDLFVREILDHKSSRLVIDRFVLLNDRESLYLEYEQKLKELPPASIVVKHDQFPLKWGRYYIKKV